MKKMQLEYEEEQRLLRESIAEKINKQNESPQKKEIGNYDDEIVPIHHDDLSTP